MADSTTARDTVSIEESVHDVYRALTEGTDPVEAPFRTMKDVFMWAAVVGARLGERRSLEGKKTVVFRWAQFSPQIDVHLLKALALSRRDDLSVLVDQEEVLTIAEEYANAGIRELKSELLDSGGQPLWNLVAQIKAEPEEG
jgi:dnd system-associated protein 4